MGNPFKHAIKSATLICISICMLAMLSCSSSESPEAESAEGSASSVQEANGNDADEAVRIGTMPTEDILPVWVAESEGIFGDYGTDAEVVVFDSAQALSAAISAGEVDMAMVDIMRAVKLCEAGSPVVLEWVTLGTKADQGRFGIMAAADAPYSDLRELAEYASDGRLAGGGVGVAANTVPEYVFDKLCEQEGIAPDAIPTQEVASLPERYSLMASGNLAAAALPGSLLALGEANGLKVLAEDSEGDNISQSVMVATGPFADDHPADILNVARAWDAAASKINAEPSSYITLLAENANLNETIAETYPISTYPMALSGPDLIHPRSSLVGPVVQWMEDKGYSAEAITYDQSTGSFDLD